MKWAVKDSDTAPWQFYPQKRDAERSLACLSTEYREQHTWLERIAVNIASMVCGAWPAKKTDGICLDYFDGLTVEEAAQALTVTMREIARDGKPARRSRMPMPAHHYDGMPGLWNERGKRVK
jgi:DNA-directed RNA polymerase specialized sigma24 family protein